MLKRKMIAALICIGFATLAMAEGFPCKGDSTGLVRAALEGKADKVKLLLDSGIHPDQRDMNCYTPLMWAAGKGHVEIVKLLLDRVADINAFNRDQHSALTFAVMSLALGTYDEKPIDVIKMLIARGADIKWKSMDGTALEIAESFDLDEAAGILKKAATK